MEWLIWIGAAVSFAGLVGVFWCIWKVTKAKRAGLSDQALRDAVKRVIPINLAAFFISFLGLLCVVVGVLLK